MALPQDFSKEDRLNANTDLKLAEDSTTDTDGVCETGKDPGGGSGGASPASVSSASALSSTRGGEQSPAVSNSANPPPLSMPHPKKFSHVNINKKFLSASTPTHALSTSPVLNMVNSSQKPPPQQTTTHPRLVTAKLTATPQSSNTSGWSRPSSAAPSNAPTPLPIANPKPVVPNTAPLLPTAGKVIQPQSRGSQDSISTKKDPSAKPAWGAPKVGATIPSKLDGVQTEFPTAAEVARGRTYKSTDKKGTPDAATAHKQAVMAELIAEEDTFRGVHLDPNAHHWDEMEEDDDNFLAGVIEFGDGRQYQVQPAEALQQSSPCDKARTLPPCGADSIGRNGMTDEPVSKEDRFADDDFDRSWPRSRTGSNQAMGPSRDQRSGRPAPPSPSSTTMHSPQDSSKVLFNERSNRLEPYSQQRHGGPAVPPHFNPRNSRSEHPTSPTEQRRDVPPHAQSQGVQLLQKGPSSNSGSHAESYNFSRAPGDRAALSPVEGSRLRDRAQPRRDYPPWQVNGPVGPEHIRSSPYGMQIRQTRDSHSDGRHRPPPLEHPITGGDNRRQLPPHLSAPGRHTPLVRIENDIPPRSPVLSPSTGPAHTELPAPSTSSQAAESPAAVSPAALPVADFEEARKAAMHSAAERARLRRQQEEEAREKEKERARKKAAEIEERMKALDQEKDQEKSREREKEDSEKDQVAAQVLGIIEEAILSIPPSDKKGNDLAEDPSQRASSARVPMGRAPSSKGTSRPFSSRGPSFTMAATTAPLSSDADSWRRIDPSSPIPQSQPQSQLPAPLLNTPFLAHSDLDVKEGEDVDVIDFADLGKLIGSESSSQPTDAPSARPHRAVAADFFTDETPAVHHPQLPPSKADEGPWRRQISTVHNQPSLLEKPAVSSSAGVVGTAPEQTHASDPAGSSTVAPHFPSHEEHHRRLSGHHQNGNIKPPVGPHYREAPMAILEDMISRVERALASAAEVQKETPTTQKWLPPAKRPKPVLDLAQADLTFAVTVVEQTESPRPVWNVFTVNLASVPRPTPPPLRTELAWPRGQRSLKLDVYSFNPPIETLCRRGTTMNDVIFDRPRFIRGQIKYPVSLPRSRASRRHIADKDKPISPVVNLPVTPPRLKNGNLKESTASSWRKIPAPPTVSWRSLARDTTVEPGLDTVSRSPPPEAPSSSVPSTTHPKAVEPSSTLPANAAPKPKMPTGSDVAFYRSAQMKTIVDPQTPVQFIVTSELDSDSKAAQVPPEVSLGSPIAHAVPVFKKVPLETKVDTVVDHVRGLANRPLTPPQPQLPLTQWSKSPKVFSLPLKESPARAPDPEHLRAVWSQTTDKAQIQPVNSLKGIADDLTGVPFSLQDVKSEDGVTPPPSVSGPWTRMSAYEVTRAFQQVPTSSSSATQRPQPMAPSATSVHSSITTNGSTSRNPTFAFSASPMSQIVRPAYPAYSPMMSHSPAPAVMYPHPSPVPRHMVVNGNPPTGYAPPVWMPGPAPPSGGLLRSPYPTQFVPYPSSGGAVPVYPSPMPGMQNPPPQNGAQGRPPGMLSPVMQPALSPAMYASSPVLVHAPPVVPQGQTYPTPAQGTRGPMRPYDQNSSPQQMPPPMRPVPQNGYTPISSNYARPPW